MIPPVLMNIFVALVIKFSLGGKFVPIDDRPAYPTYCTMDTTEPYFALPVINYLPAFLQLCPPKLPVQMEYAPLDATACDESRETVKSSAFVPASSPAANSRIESSDTASAYPVQGPASPGLPNVLLATQHQLVVVLELGRDLSEQAHRFAHQLGRAIEAAGLRRLRSLKKLGPRSLTAILLGAVVFSIICTFGGRHIRLTETLDPRGETQDLEHWSLERDMAVAGDSRRHGRGAANN